MENGVSHNPQNLLWEELLKKKPTHASQKNMALSCFPYGVRVFFLDKGPQALSTHHLFFDVISIFRTLFLPLCS